MLLHVWTHCYKWSPKSPKTVDCNTLFYRNLLPTQKSTSTNDIFYFLLIVVDRIQTLDYPFDELEYSFEVVLDELVQLGNRLAYFVGLLLDMLLMVLHLFLIVLLLLDSLIENLVQCVLLLIDSLWQMMVIFDDLERSFVLVRDFDHQIVLVVFIVLHLVELADYFSLVSELTIYLHLIVISLA